MNVIVMGVMGCGKTTVGKALAKKLGWKFFDADDYHSQANKEKMRAGKPLTDEERLPWLLLLRELLHECIDTKRNCVLACSALKRKYRDILTVDRNKTKVVYLKGSFATIKKRIESRSNHFIQSSGLLKNQFAVLEEPEDALIVKASAKPDSIVEKIVQDFTVKKPGKR